MYRLVQKSSVYTISELQEYAVQFVFFSSLHLLFIQKVSKKGGRRMSRRMASKDPPSTLDTACQTDTCDLKLSSSLTLPFPTLPHHTPYFPKKGWTANVTPHGV